MLFIGEFEEFEETGRGRKIGWVDCWISGLVGAGKADDQTVLESWVPKVRVSSRRLLRWFRLCLVKNGVREVHE